MSSEDSPAAVSGFRCRRCGNCCRVEGYVRLTDDEVSAVAAHLGMSVSAFTRQHTRLTSDRRGLSLKERADQSCVFLTKDNVCAIEAVKPRQCLDFPHKWVFEGVEDVCEGMKL